MLDLSKAWYASWRLCLQSWWEQLLNLLLRNTSKVCCWQSWQLAMSASTTHVEQSLEVVSAAHQNPGILVKAEISTSFCMQRHTENGTTVIKAVMINCLWVLFWCRHTATPSNAPGAAAVIRLMIKSKLAHKTLLVCPNATKSTNWKDAWSQVCRVDEPIGDPGHKLATT